MRQGKEALHHTIWFFVNAPGDLPDLLMLCKRRAAPSPFFTWHPK